MRRFASVFLLGAIITCGAMVPRPAAAAYWYVDGLNGTTDGQGSPSRPFAFFWQAVKVTKPGDTIYLLPTTVYPYLVIGISGTSGHPITIAGAGAAPTLTQVGGSSSYFGIQISASYITLSNLDVTAGGAQTAVQVTQGRHHIVISGNTIHDAGGNGISAIGADYVTISHNIIYGNANSSVGSGISLLRNTDVDANTGVKMTVDSNVIYANTNKPGCSPQPACLANARDTNGNGVSVGDTRHTTTDQSGYGGTTLISNNVIFGNGGRGAYVYQSDHVTVTDNTIYFNNQDPYEAIYRPGEVMASYASDIVVANNILYSDGGTAKHTGVHVPLSFQYCSVHSGPLVANNNLGYDPQNDQQFFYGRANTATLVMEQNGWGDPLFEVASLDPAVADFRVTTSSPALRAGDTGTSVPLDILGAARVIPPSIGAYQAAGP